MFAQPQQQHHPTLLTAMPTSTTVKVLVLPLVRRYWLWHAWKEAPVSTTTPPKPWQEGASLQEKLQLLLGGIQRWGSRQADTQWHKLSTAPEGTFNHRLFRLAQEVLSRVDPNESFLKVLPQTADALQFTYPASLQQRLVRRRLRLLAAKAQPFHASRLRLWSLLLVPQLPLIPLPLPNVTIYFTIWRIISNRNAGRGAAALSQALDQLSDLQRLQLARQLQDLQQQGLTLRPNTWAAQLAADVGRLQQKCQQEAGTDQLPGSSSSSVSSSGATPKQSTEQPSNGQQQQQHEAGGQKQQQQQQQPKGLPLPVFIPCQELDALVQPQDRLVQLLPEDRVEQLMQQYQQPHLLEHYRAACKTCAAQETAPD